MMQVSLSSTTTVPITMLLNTTSNLVLFIYIQATFLIYLKIFLLFSFAFYLNNVPGFIDTLDACCGAGPTFPYNFNPLLYCNAGSIVCPFPKTYLNWDGFHFTHAFNLQVFQLTIIKGLYLNPFNAFESCYNP